MLDKKLDTKELLKKVFDAIGKPETLVIPNVLLEKGGELKGVYVIPFSSEYNAEVFLSEDNARRARKDPNDSIYRVDVTRVE